MTARKINGLDELKKGRFGIFEPSADSQIIASDSLDLALIPSLVCDKKGRRIGFGGGYYDRYFKKTDKAKKIILCPSDMMKKRVPNAPFDLLGDMVVYS